VTKLLITVEEGLSGQVTLRRGQGGQIVCENADRGTTATSARTVKAEPAATRPAKEPAAPAKEPAATRAAKDPAATRAATEPAAARTTKPARAEGPTKPRRSTSLSWKPTTDAGFKGLVAKTEGGRFKLLKSTGSQWALFKERPDTKPEHLGCFVKEELGKAAAQKLHDVPTKPRPVTEASILEACPMPSGDEPEVQRPAAPEPARPEAEQTNADMDAELMASLKQTLAELEAD